MNDKCFRFLLVVGVFFVHILLSAMSYPWPIFQQGSQRHAITGTGSENRCSDGNICSPSNVQRDHFHKGIDIVANNLQNPTPVSSVSSGNQLICGGDLVAVSSFIYVHVDDVGEMSTSRIQSLIPNNSYLARCWGNVDSGDLIGQVNDDHLHFEEYDQNIVQMRRYEGQGLPTNDPLRRARGENGGLDPAIQDNTGPNIVDQGLIHNDEDPTDQDTQPFPRINNSDTWLVWGTVDAWASFDDPGVRPNGRARPQNNLGVKKAKATIEFNTSVIVDFEELPSVFQNSVRQQFPGKENYEFHDYNTIPGRSSDTAMQNLTQSTFLAGSTTQQSIYNTVSKSIVFEDRALPFLEGHRFFTPLADTWFWDSNHELNIDEFSDGRITIDQNSDTFLRQIDIPRGPYKFLTKAYPRTGASMRFTFSELTKLDLTRNCDFGTNSEQTKLVSSGDYQEENLIPDRIPTDPVRNSVAQSSYEFDGIFNLGLKPEDCALKLSGEDLLGNPLDGNPTHIKYRSNDGFDTSENFKDSFTFHYFFDYEAPNINIGVNREPELGTIFVNLSVSDQTNTEWWRDVKNRTTQPIAIEVHFLNSSVADAAPGVAPPYPEEFWVERRGDYQLPLSGDLDFELEFSEEIVSEKEKEEEVLVAAVKDATGWVRFKGVFSSSPYQEMPVVRRERIDDSNNGENQPVSLSSAGKSSPRRTNQFSLSMLHNAKEPPGEKIITEKVTFKSDEGYHHFKCTYGPDTFVLKPVTN